MDSRSFALMCVCVIVFALSSFPAPFMKHCRLFLVVSMTSVMVLSFVGIVYAGSLSPSASPAATSYTLSDIFDRLTTNAAATAGNHAFMPSGTPAASFKSLTQIYDAIPTITAAKVFTGSTYLGVTGNLVLACATDTFDATANRIANDYDGGGNGSNRWCMKDTGDAGAGDILSGKIAWVDGVEITGSATAGADLSGMWNGTGQGITGGSQVSGGIDDYNNNGVPPTGRFAADWTACHAGTTPDDAGNDWCGTGDSGAASMDALSGLIWSKTMNSGTPYALDNSAGSTTWYVANNCTESSGSACTKKTSSKTGCEATTGWSLPHQKQLMQAYIDGSYGNLEPSNANRFYWSATSRSDFTSFALAMYLNNGNTYSSGKTGSNPVRCVRMIP